MFGFFSSELPALYAESKAGMKSFIFSLTTQGVPVSKSLCWGPQTFDPADSQTHTMCTWQKLQSLS